MYFQLNVTKHSISIYFHAVANLVEDLSEIQYKQDQLKAPDEVLNKKHQVKKEMLDFLLFCLERLEGRTKPVVLYIKNKLKQIIPIICAEIEKTSSSIVEQKMSSLTLESTSAELSKAEFRCKVLTNRLANLRKIEQVVDVLVLKNQEEEIVNCDPCIQFSFEEYVYYSGKFKAKNIFLDKFFMAFDCLGEKHFSFPGPVADSKYYLKQALFNAKKNLEAELVLQDEVVVPKAAPEAQDNSMHEGQPMMVVSPMMKRSSACLHLLDLDEEASSDDSYALEPPRSPSAQRFF